MLSSLLEAEVHVTHLARLQPRHPHQIVVPVLQPDPSIEIQVVGLGHLSRGVVGGQDLLHRQLDLVDLPLLPKPNLPMGAVPCIEQIPDDMRMDPQGLGGSPDGAFPEQLVSRRKDGFLGEHTRQDTGFFNRSARECGKHGQDG